MQSMAAADSQHAGSVLHPECTLALLKCGGGWRAEGGGQRRWTGDESRFMYGQRARARLTSMVVPERNAGRIPGGGVAIFQPLLSLVKPPNPRSSSFWRLKRSVPLYINITAGIHTMFSVPIDYCSSVASAARDRRRKNVCSDGEAGLPAPCPWPTPPHCWYLCLALAKDARKRGLGSRMTHTLAASRGDVLEETR
jgi:hypothetical protein